MSLIYAKNTLLAELNTLKGDHEALLEKHRKLSLNTQSLVDRVKLSERGQKIAENKTRLLTGQLSLAQKRVKILEKNEKIIIPPNKELMTIENKYNQLVGKVRQAKSKIITLNSNTPYRPGAVERTLKDIEEGLKNV